MFSEQPPQVDSLQIKNAGTTHVELTWQAPYPAMGPISEYVIRYQTGGGVWVEKTINANTNLQCKDNAKNDDKQPWLCYTVEDLKPISQYK